MLPQEVPNEMPSITEIKEESAPMEMPSIMEIKEESSPMDVIVISSDEEMQRSDNEASEADNEADNEASDSESETVKTDDMPLLEELPGRMYESAPALRDPATTSDADFDRFDINE